MTRNGTSLTTSRTQQHNTKELQHGRSTMVDLVPRWLPLQPPAVEGFALRCSASGQVNWKARFDLKKLCDMLETPKATHDYQGETVMDETMGNQQGVVTELELAWLAGMLNGDGCFSIKFRVRGEALKCDISLTLTQCDVCLIDAASDIMARLGISPSIVEYAPSGAGVNTKYNLRVTRMAHISIVLAAIIPHMRGGKLAQARLMQRYIVRRTSVFDPQFRKENQIIGDTEALGIAKEFYATRGQQLPPDVTKALNDYPAREYPQARGSAQRSQE